MPSRDPRMYVKAVPLPITSQKGLKLQARSEIVYNPTSPSREQVRKWNYDRRLQQMTDQGFYAYNYKPYKGLGDPFYLDEKKMILHALGQWDETQEWETSSSSEDDDDGEASPAFIPQTSMTAAKFVLRRTRKDLNTLGKEVVRGRDMMRNVRLGHGLFDLIRQDRTAKKAAALAEKQKSLEASRNQWQPPKESSSEDESDEDLEKEEDLETYFGPSLSDTERRTGTPAPSILDRASSAKTQGSVKKKKKQVTPRPFTPQHTNLAEVKDERDDISRDALFRQLCALTWILDAMNIEQGSTMGPISTCWSHTDIGGSKVSAKRAREERRAEADWERWLNNQQMGRLHKKGSVTRLNRLSRAQRLVSHPRVSLQSTSISPSSSSSQVNVQQSGLASLMAKEVIHEDRPSPQHDDEEETLHRTGIFKFLDEYYDSLRKENQHQQHEDKGDPVAAASAEPSHMEEESAPKTRKSREGKSSRKSKRSQDRQKTPDRSMRFDSPEDRNRARFTLKDIRNDFNYKPKNSAELMEFHATKPSIKYSTLRQDLHNKFKEVQDDKALTLHDVLEQMERERLSKCQNKFSCLQTKSMSFHRAIEGMRKEGERMIARPEDVRRQSSFKGNWYTELLHGIPSDVKHLWFYRTVLHKLGKYGMVENTSKQSVYKFVKVLSTLRHWEICSPDIAAAIEFCRENIVDMSIDEYEEWFAQTFPKVLRPKTAPAATRSQQQQASNTAITATANGGASEAGAASVGGSNVRAPSRGGAKSAVSVANGLDGRRRLVQSAMPARR